MTLVEAYATGLPVVGSAIGSLRELVEDFGTGRQFRAGECCGSRGVLEWMVAIPREVAEQGRRARQTFEQRYTAERNYAELLEIYRIGGRACTTTRLSCPGSWSSPTPASPGAGRSPGRGGESCGRWPRWRAAPCWWVPSTGRARALGPSRRGAQSHFRRGGASRPGAATPSITALTWFPLYLLWLRRAREEGLRRHRLHPFDLAYHATYSTYWLPEPGDRFGVPSVWGPVGGAVVTPPSLWGQLGLRGFVGEVLDAVSIATMSRLPATRRTWRRASIRIVQNEATLAALPAALRPTTRVLNHATLVEVPALARRRPTRRILSIGPLDSRKGVALAIRGLVHAAADVRLVIVGDGPRRRVARGPGPPAGGGPPGGVSGTGGAGERVSPAGGGGRSGLHRTTGGGRAVAGGSDVLRGARHRAGPRRRQDPGRGLAGPRPCRADSARPARRAPRARWARR